MTIKQEFQENNPSLTYVNHELITPSLLGVGFVCVRGPRSFAGVRLYPIKDGKIQWNSSSGVLDSWADLKDRRQR